MRPSSTFVAAAASLLAAGITVLACTTSDNEAGGPAGASTGPADSCADIDVQTDPLNCGSCGRTCVLPHAVASCAAGECALGECALGFSDCDHDVNNGCELEDSCAEGSACLTSCGSMGALACADPCAPACSLPSESCNAADDDCDGVCDNGAIPGCRLAVHRAYNGASGHLFTTDLAEAQAWGLESQNFFYLYADAAADLRPFFRCPKGGTGNFKLSDSNDCEMTAAPLLTVGFIAPAPQPGIPPTCGSIPLYRIHLPANNWHFYTTSLAERDAAITNGWVDQGLAGYVFPGP